MELTTADLEESIQALESALAKCEKAMQKLTQGTPHHTLMTRRIKALRIAISLIKERLEA